MQHNYNQAYYKMVKSDAGIRGGPSLAQARAHMACFSKSSQ
jgi:hypothetical protein